MVHSSDFAMIMDKIWSILHYTFYWDNIPFTLWDVAYCGLIVSVFAMFLKEIVFVWRSRNE